MSSSPPARKAVVSAGAAAVKTAAALNTPEAKQAIKQGIDLFQDVVDVMASPEVL